MVSAKVLYFSSRAVDDIFNLNLRAFFPTVKLDSALVTGKSSNSGKVEQFLGISFASAP